MKVAVIGGGASGLMAAGRCASLGNSVDLFEANEKVGKKLYITGKGRCNVTNYSEPQEHLNNVVNNYKFLYSAEYSLTSFDIIDFFEKLGVPIKIERGNRAFPVSDKSSDIISALNRYNQQNGTNIRLNEAVISIEKKDNKFTLTTKYGVYNNYDATILCTGGLTYKSTGSTGDGYIFAKKFGHGVTKILPGLVPIILSDGYIKTLEGLSLKNVTLKAKYCDGLTKEFFGEMLFTSNGISGPIALSMSSYINKYDNVALEIDFKPALTDEKLCSRISRDIDELKEKQVSTLISGLLPKVLVNVFLNKAKIDPSRRNKTLNTIEINNIVQLLKHFAISYAGLDKLDYGIITCGGVETSEIDPHTMQSKLVPGLYFAGEIIDVDALTGGFNLQIAFSTGYVAGSLMGFKGVNIWL